MDVIWRYQKFCRSRYINLRARLCLCTSSQIENYGFDKFSSLRNISFFDSNLTRLELWLHPKTLSSIKSV
jgi:hypothetical protein